MASASYFYDTETIIVNLIKQDNKSFLSLGRLYDSLRYIYVQLQKRKILDNYQILFDVYFGAIENTIINDGDLFSLDIENNIIYLINKAELDEISSDYKLDDTLDSIIKEFVLKKPALEVV